jgi:hypothetical protein
MSAGASQNMAYQYGQHKRMTEATGMDLQTNGTLTASQNMPSAVAMIIMESSLKE